jgi:hypothetical protein
VIIARLIVRHARGASRLERGREPDRGVGGQVDVDQAGDAVLAEQRRGRPRLPDQALVDVRTGLDLLVRVDPDPREHVALGAEDDLVADRSALLDPDVGADVAVPPDDRALDERAAADVGRGVDHRTDGARALAQRHARGQHRVGADRRLRRDPAVVAHERRAFDVLEVVDLDALADPDVAAQAQARDVEVDVAVECVEVRLAVVVQVPDVLPVAVADHPVHRPPHLQQQRKELLREVVRPVGGDVLEHLGLEHVDAGVDRVGEDLPPGRFLEEPLDPAVLVGDDDPELERVLDRLQPDGHGRAALLVEVDQLCEVDVAERVAGDDENGVVELAGREPH